MNLKKDGSFVMFKHNGEIKQISHTDNNVIWFTDKSFLYPMDYDLVKPITLKQINNLLNKLRQVNKKSNTKKSVCDHYYAEALGTEICIYCKKSRNENDLKLQ